jgi:hypothetical protein
MKKKRLDELEKNMGNIDPELMGLVELYKDFKKALSEGDTKTAEKLREDAEGWFKTDGRFTKLAYWPPEGTSIAIRDWHKFVKYNWNYDYKKRKGML